MTEVLSSAQMRAIEAMAMTGQGVAGIDLMERAGAGVVAAILQHWPELQIAPAPSLDDSLQTGAVLRAEAQWRALVFCGPGNNGGDGFVIARLLRELGWTVDVFLLGQPEQLPPDARRNFDRWSRLGQTRPLAALDWDETRAADLVVDALFGTGLSREIAPGVWGALAMAQESGARLVAVDILSGLCADSGRALSSSGYLEVPADLTVTFERAKRGHLLAQGRALSGKICIVPIGLEAEMQALLRGDAAGAVVDVVAPSVSRFAKTEGHKYSHGHAVVIGGPSGQGGAARLAARGALRIGAGLVTIACPPEALAENAARLDAVMLRVVDDAEALAAMLDDRRINALCLGPGMGTGARAASLLAAALGLYADRVTSEDQADKHPARSVVLDADALTILSQRPDLFAALPQRAVLTPHAGEFARLFPEISANLQAPAQRGPAYSKVDACRDAARKAGCTVLFKGPDTVIADPSGFAAITDTYGNPGAPWLATAGSGDVLAGFIAGLLARGYSPFDAACAGAWLHLECARGAGPGLIAEDLPEALPGVFRDLGV